MKESIKRETEFQPKLLDLPTISNMKTDEIFTHLLVQHGRKPFKDEEDMERKEFLRRYGQVRGTRVEHCQEIFLRIADDEKNPDSILLTGKAGIGKTVFCQKLIRDWADGQLFHSPPPNAQIPDFKFAFLMTFRQLNLLGDQTLTLKELLNRSKILDDQTNIDDSLLEYILYHSEEVLIIIDGFDEYSQHDYIAGNDHEEFPNNVREKIPVAALCAKLMRGKVLRKSTVVITSRPDESEKISGIRFDRMVEITGFADREVKEYIEKYFRKNKTMKNIVLEHITNNENLVSLAHIPVLCAMMCSYMEYILQESNYTEDLPVSTGELYFEVFKNFELKHNKNKSSHFDENTLDKVSEFAARLLVEKKFIFTEGDMRTLTIQEVESLRTSGLLHCSPPLRVSFSQTAKDYCFTHLTLHEYLAARWFVKRKEIPKTDTISEMVLQFMAGILSKEKDSQLMKKLLIGLPTGHGRVLLEAKCLFEYQDEQLAKDHYRQHPFREKMIGFSDINDVDCIAVSFLLDNLSALNEDAAAAKHQPSEQSFKVAVNIALDISHSNLAVSGVKRICKSLQKDFSDVIELSLRYCQITDVSVASLCEALKHPSCKVTTLNLNGNQITDAGVASLCEALKYSSCKVTTLKLSGNQINNAGAVSLCEALKHKSCRVTTLALSGNRITDAGVASLCEALKYPSCKVTELKLSGIQITDAGVFSLCEVLKHRNCKVAILDLSRNQITVAGVVSLCEALKPRGCKVTSLRLSGNQISDDGVASLCEALKHPNCKVSELNLSGNQISDAGVVSLCEALKHNSCRVTTLDLTRNQVTDAGVGSLCEALRYPSCKVKELNLSGNQISDTGVISLFEAVKHKSCRVTTLDLNDNRITDAGVVKLREALIHPSCNITRLNLLLNFGISKEQKESVRNTLKQHKPDFELYI